MIFIYLFIVLGLAGAYKHDKLAEITLYDLYD